MLASYDCCVLVTITKESRFNYRSECCSDLCILVSPKILCAIRSTEQVVIS